MEAYSRRKPYVDGIQELGEIAPDVADSFRAFRHIINDRGPLERLQRELCLLAGFVVARNERGFRIHCNLAAAAGATHEQVQQVVMLMIGANMGLMPMLDTLAWAKDEFEGMSKA